MPPKKNKTNNYEQFFSPRVTRHASRRAAANVVTATSTSITAVFNQSSLLSITNNTSTYNAGVRSLFLYPKFST